MERGRRIKLVTDLGLSCGYIVLSRHLIAPRQALDSWGNPELHQGKPWTPGAIRNRTKASLGLLGQSAIAPRQALDSWGNPESHQGKPWTPGAIPNCTKACSQRLPVGSYWKR